jgi:hypothetical protein
VGGRRRWLAAILRISSSSTKEVLNISGREAAMDAKEKILGRESENENGDRFAVSRRDLRAQRLEFKGKD